MESEGGHDDVWLREPEKTIDPDFLDHHTSSLSSLPGPFLISARVLKSRDASKTAWACNLLLKQEKTDGSTRIWPLWNSCSPLLQGPWENDFSHTIGQKVRKKKGNNPSQRPNAGSQLSLPTMIKFWPDCDSCAFGKGWVWNYLLQMIFWRMFSSSSFCCFVVLPSGIIWQCFPFCVHSRIAVLQSNSPPWPTCNPISFL